MTGSEKIAAGPKGSRTGQHCAGPARLYLLNGALAAAVFVADLSLERGVAGGVLYVAVVGFSARSEQDIRLAFDSSPSGMLLVDRRGQIVLVNAEIERLFGYQRDELVGKSIEILVPERYREESA
jgi:PAS domain-containing protein